MENFPAEFWKQLLISPHMNLLTDGISFNRACKSRQKTTDDFMAQNLIQLRSNQFKAPKLPIKSTGPL